MNLKKFYIQIGKLKKERDRLHPDWSDLDFNYIRERIGTSISNNEVVMCLASCENNTQAIACIYKMRYAESALSDIVDEENVFMDYDKNKSRENHENTFKEKDSFLNKRGNHNEKQ